MTGSRKSRRRAAPLGFVAGVSLAAAALVSTAFFHQPAWAMPAVTGWALPTAQWQPAAAASTLAAPVAAQLPVSAVVQQVPLDSLRQTLGGVLPLRYSLAPFKGAFSALGEAAFGDTPAQRALGAQRLLQPLLGGYDSEPLRLAGAGMQLAASPASDSSLLRGTWGMLLGGAVLVVFSMRRRISTASQF